MFHQNQTRTAGTLHEDHWNVLIMSGSFLPRYRNVCDKSCGENQNTCCAK